MKSQQRPKNKLDNSVFAKQKFAIYILGAGFSKPAGLPLATELWHEIRQRGMKMSGSAKHFQYDLKDYLEYQKNCNGIELTYEQVKFEDFMAFLDIEHFLGLRGSNTWSSHGNETQVVVKTLIGEILNERMPNKDNIPNLYIEFAKILKPNDIVLTFNYDILLERSLEASNVPFRLFPQRLKKSVDTPGQFEVDERDEVIVMKLHGSIDWFDRSEYTQLEEDRILQGYDVRTPDLIFQNPKKFEAQTLINGPHNSDHPLHEIYRIKKIKKLYKFGILFKATPFLINPSPIKMIYAQRYKDFWWGLGRAGILNFGMALIGFSLSEQDEYARQIIYRLFRNYQNVYWNDDVWPHKKSPLILIDLNKSDDKKKDYRERYSFVNWDRTIQHNNGFDKEAINILKKNTVTEEA